MTGLDRNQTPKTRPVDHKRTALVASLDVGNARAMLSKLDKEDRLCSRDIVAVDLRLPDRLTVQLSEEAAKAREELFKEKKPKKKAGDA